MAFRQKRSAWLVPAFLLLILVAIIGYTLRSSAVVDRALRRLSLLGSAHVVATVELTNADATQALIGEQGVVTLTFDGDMRRSATGPDEAAGDVLMSIATDSVRLEAEGQLRLIEDTLYLLVEQAPPVFPALVQLKGQWIALPRGGTGAAMTTRATAEPFSGYRRIGRDGEIGATHYRAEATGDAVVGLMDELADFLGTELSTEQVDSLKTSLDRSQAVPVDVWIKLFTQKIVRLEATIEAVSGNVVRFALDVSDHNKPVTLAKPAGAKTIEQILVEQQNK